MNKEHQIEEIMLTVPQKIVAYDGNPAGQHLYGEQRQEIAEALYNAGYRKIDGDNYVSREWHDEQVLHLESELEMLKSEKENIVHNCTVITKAELKEYKRQAVKEFAEKLKENSIEINSRDFGFMDFVGVDAIDELLKEYEQ